MQPGGRRQNCCVLTNQLITDPLRLAAYSLDMRPPAWQRIRQQLTRQLLRPLDGHHNPSVEGRSVAYSSGLLNKRRLGVSTRLPCTTPRVAVVVR